MRQSSGSDEATVDVSEVALEILEVFRDVFEDDDLQVSSDSTAADVAGWDSLRHVTLIFTLEARFGIRMSSAEVADVQTVGELVDIVNSRRKVD